MAATRLIALHKNKGKSVAACLKSRTDYGADGKAAFSQQLCRPCHAVVQQEPLRAFAHGIPEHFAEIAAVQSAEGGDVLDGNIFAVMLL